MAYQYQASDVVEPISDVDIEMLGNQQKYGVISGCEVTYSLSDLVATIAAGVVLINGAEVTVAQDTVTLVPSGTADPRWAWIGVDDAGAGQIDHGAAAADPLKPELSDVDLPLATVLIPGALVIANDATAKIDKRIPASASAALSSAAQTFIDGDTKKAFFALGPAPGLISVATGAPIGLGFTVFETGSAAVSSGYATDGSWQMVAGTSSGDDAGFYGPKVTVAQDPVMIGRIPWPTGGANAANRVFGFIGASTGFNDGNDSIGFRAIQTGNIIGFCDSGGTETTRDTGVAPDGTEYDLEIRVTTGGTIVQFFKDGVQVGADVTTNIPTGTLYTAIGAVAAGASGSTMAAIDVFGWRDV